MKKATSAIAIALSIVSTAILAHGEKPHSAKFTAAQLSEEKTFGKAGDPKQAKRVITVDMSDKFRYSPSSISVKQGDTVKFVLKNSGKIMHEFVLGSVQELKEHSELMKKFPKMEHAEPYMSHVKPGATDSMIWQFTKVGEFQYGCLLPGHYEAGMVGKITVTNIASSK